MPAVKLIRTIVLLGIVCLASMSILLMVLAPIVRSNDIYMAASLDKENRLSTIPSPRLVFIGGSNLALGLNSAKIESVIGLNVVNMGLHGGLGLSFDLNEAQAGLKQGDMVILSIEYFLAGGNKKLMAQLIDVNPNALKFLDLSPFDAVRLYTQSVQRCLNNFFYKCLNINQSHPFYHRKGFTIRGDLISHFRVPKPNQLGDNIAFTCTDYSAGIAEINQFIKNARHKGASVFFTYPVFPESAYKLNKRALDALSLQYHASLKCPILGTAETFVLPDHYFFDTVYHLDSIGVQKRTSIMVDLLRSSGIETKNIIN